MAWRIEVLRPAARALRGLPRADQRAIAAAIDGLAAEPRPPGSRVLRGSRTLYRIRVGDYRIVYAIEAERLVVLVVRIGHRREVYRRLERLRSLR